MKDTLGRKISRPTKQGKSKLGDMRLSREMTVEELLDKTGIARATYVPLENKTRLLDTASIKKILLIADVFDCKLGDILEDPETVRICKRRNI